MDGKKVLCLLAAALFCRISPGWAATPACSSDSPERTNVPPLRLERATVDPATHARIVVRKEQDGALAVEFATPQTSIRKVVTRTGSSTTLASGGERAVIALTGEAIAISAAGRSSRASARHPQALNDAIRDLRQSAVGKAAKDLLDRAALRPDTFEGNALLLTRALLGTFWGDSTPTIEYQRWARARLERSRVTKAALSDGPGECWDKYAAEAIRISNDYIACANDCHWAGQFCMGACGFLYDVRAEAAFMWFMSCSGGFYVG